ncbi:MULTISPECIES: hypothetical protein [unclassified Paraburkholderia]|uniref:hypothetical protein n=1 Tax=unclassified Paraburkholderia TaxID=2615204 RepID=UPI002AB0E9D3|nr:MULTISPECIES: hypothetical protein [unclassified Paraburkholderia]
MNDQREHSASKNRGGVSAALIDEFRAHLLVASLVAVLFQLMVFGWALMFDDVEAFCSTVDFREGVCVGVVVGVLAVRHIADCAYERARRDGCLMFDKSGHDPVSIIDGCRYPQLVMLHVRLNRRRFGYAFGAGVRKWR